MRYHNHAAEFDALFGLMIRSNKTLEINTQTVAVLRRAGYSGLDAWPDAAILRRYRALGGASVSLGSDAHQAAQVGSLLAEGAAWLSGLGFAELTHHVNRRPVLTPLAPASDRSSPQP
jgi:histidinol-phosphatase (PHP family)